MITNINPLSLIGGGLLRSVSVPLIATAVITVTVGIGIVLKGYGDGILAKSQNVQLLQALRNKEHSTEKIVASHKSTSDVERELRAEIDRLKARPVEVVEQPVGEMCVPGCVMGDVDQ